MSLSDLADRYVGPPLGALIELGVIIDLLAVAAVASNAIARGVFALAPDGLLPRPLASRFETPRGGIVANATFALAGLATRANWRTGWPCSEPWRWPSR